MLRRSQYQPAASESNCTELGADLFAMLSEVDRQQRECHSNNQSTATTPRRDSSAPFTYPASSLLGDSLSRRSSSVASEDPDSISINSMQQGHRTRLRSCPKLLLVKRKNSGSGKKNVRWRAITQARVPPPSPDNSIGALVEHSTSFMLQQFINPQVGGEEVRGMSPEDAESTLNNTQPTVSRSMPNIGGGEDGDDDIWSTPSPPPRWKKRENADEGPWP